MIQMAIMRRCTWKASTGLVLAALLAACGDSSPIDLLASESDASAAAESGGEAGKSCALDDDCSPPRPYCDKSLGRCVECLAALNCVSGVCDPELHACVECLQDQQCPEENHHCLKESHVCVQCGSELDCFGELRHCEPVSHRCVECITGGQCPGGECSVDFECSGG